MTAGPVAAPLWWSFKLSGDTTIEGLITNADESAHREEVERVVDWCTNNDLELNVAKTKEMVIDFRENKTAMPPLARLQGEQDSYATIS